MVAAFERAVLLQGAYLIRSRTIRHDLQYQVEMAPPPGRFLHDFGLPWIRQALSTITGTSRAIIYTQDRATTDHVATLLQCPSYYSDSGTEEEKAAVLQSWRGGDVHWLVATSAFGLGIDYGQVRLVIHLGPPRSMIDFAQETGRLGRDGQGGRSCILLPPRWKPQDQLPTGAIIPAEQKAMQAFMGQPRCRKQPLGRFLDGDPVACQPGDPFCDRCEELGPVEDGSTEEKAVEEEAMDLDEPSSSDSDTVGLGTGMQLLQTHIREEAQAFQRYRDRLQELKGTCIFCRLHPHVGMNRRPQHPMRECRNQLKFAFFTARKAAEKAGQGRSGGWMSSYAGCYRCYNAQSVCDRQASGQCEFPDLVMPLCWAMYQNQDWVRQELPGLAQRGFADEEAYMQWLGEERAVHGVQASNAMYIADQVFAILVGGVDLV
jgi:hypothetical protein